MTISLGLEPEHLARLLREQPQMIAPLLANVFTLDEHPFDPDMPLAGAVGKQFRGMGMAGMGDLFVALAMSAKGWVPAPAEAPEMDPDNGLPGVPAVDQVEEGEPCF